MFYGWSKRIKVDEAKKGKGKYIVHQTFMIATGEELLKSDLMTNL
jgi:hypothetical protein